MSLMRSTKTFSLLFRIAIYVSFFVGSSSGSAGATERNPEAIKSGEILRGNFVQDRRLAGFSKPLRTEGAFVLIPGQGLIWRALTPFQNTVVISPEGLLVLADGKEAMHLPSSRMPGLGRLYEVLGGAVSGDLKALGKAFAVNRSDDGDGWRLVLTPLKSDSLAASQIQSLTVTGHRFVETIEIHKDGDDVDFLKFNNQVASTASPNAEETSLLQSLRK